MYPTLPVVVSVFASASTRVPLFAALSVVSETNFYNIIINIPAGGQAK
jgi:hypothetical protein